MGTNSAFTCLTHIAIYPQHSSLESINRTNLAVVAPPLSFDGGVSLTNSNGSRVELRRTETMLSCATNVPWRRRWHTPVTNLIDPKKQALIHNGNRLLSQ
ncbi:MAG TPA: hypothetical protein VFZ59_04850 [Verrucomicrobiae bacterium]|nr:hypothetical protein [Verrucomicrobiae bacterium]